ncbi:MAG: serine/threonine protein kinase [Cyanobacteria bacterium]|nr:serine/threonine protein kinase [Cyanobacteriota bacterium]
MATILHPHVAYTKEMTDQNDDNQLALQFELKGGDDPSPFAGRPVELQEPSSGRRLQIVGDDAEVKTSIVVTSENKPGEKVSRVTFDFSKKAVTEKEETSSTVRRPTDVTEKEFPLERYQPIEVIYQTERVKTFWAKDKLLGQQTRLTTIADVDEEQYREFKKNARKACRLQHETVLPTLDFGTTEDRTAYLAAKHPDGISLSDYLLEFGTVGTTKSIEIMLQLCDGLSQAHKDELTHCGISSNRIHIVDTISDDLRVQISDFAVGNLELRDGPSSYGKRHVEDGGTLFYRAPEAISEKVADARSDIYSLGCIFFECLTGRCVFPGWTVEEVMFMHCKEEPPSLQKADPDGDHILEATAIVERCLRKDPGERFGSVDDLRNSLLELKELVLYGGGTKAKTITEVPKKQREKTLDEGYAVIKMEVAAIIIMMIVLAAALPNAFYATRMSEFDEDEDSVSLPMKDAWAKRMDVLYGPVTLSQMQAVDWRGILTASFYRTRLVDPKALSVLSQSDIRWFEFNESSGLSRRALEQLIDPNGTGRTDSHLTAFAFTRSDVKPQFLVPLQLLKSPLSISVVGCAWTDADLAVLADQPLKIEALDLRGNPDITIKGLLSLSGKGIKCIRAEGTDVTFDQEIMFRKKNPNCMVTTEYHAWYMDPIPTDIFSQ